MKEINALWLVFLLTIVIRFTSILAISARIVAIRTRKFSTSFSLFNIITIVAQVSTSIQAPLLANHIEKQINNHLQPDIFLFRLIIGSATIGTFLGILTIPTAHRFMFRGVNSLYENRSVFKVVLKSFRLNTFSFKLTLESIFFNKFVKLKIKLIPN